MSGRTSAHGLAALVALIVFLIFAFTNSKDVRESLLYKEGELIDIGIEHAQPLSLRLVAGLVKQNTFVEITNEGEESIKISVPTSWERAEVRDAALKDVLSEPSSFGFTRWTFPPKSTVSFRSPGIHTRFLVHNPSAVSIKIDFVTVDIEGNQAETKVILLKDSPVELVVE